MTTPILDSDALKELTRLANALVEAEQAVEAAEQALKDAKARERHLREVEVPDYMQELGVQKLTLESGDAIGYKPDVRLEWDHEKKERAFKWLEEHEFGGMIKTEVISSFGKGELEKAKELLKSLAEQGLDPVLERDVNWQTMCAFLREQIEEGNPIPLEEWGAVSINKATVSKPRKKKG